MQQRFDLAAESMPGKQRPMNCLEGLMMALLSKNFPLDAYPSEFQAFFFEKDEVVKVYFSYGDGRKWNLSPPSHELVTKRMMSDLEAG